MFLFLSLIVDLYFLVPAIFIQFFIVAPELATGIPTKEAKVEMETHPVTVISKIS